jgi:fatty acid desaturase
MEPHEPHWLSRAAFPVLVIFFFSTQAALAFALYRSNYWLVVPLALVASHLMHGMSIGFHEASHGHLRKSRLLNEVDGHIIGIFSLMSFSLYRAAHQLHHAYLASERDEELWPFVHPRMPRWVRVGAAVLELTMGMFFTPFLFVRTFLRKGSPIRNKKLRRRIWIEFAITAAVWTAILTADSLFGGWKYFLWMYFLPAWLAANMQSLRKYVEHVGLTGATVNGSTRSIIANGWHAKFICFTLLHEPYHGVHHWRSGLPHPELPRYAAALEPAVPEESPPFRTYRAALHDLFVNLPDPHVGAQWLGVTRTTRQERAQQGLN